ncbi:flotillin domain-containing protein [Taklimakanibacter lacteus]|uniref:flotillin domain-containing protein n=1 Tax=Taklimakanibacter lacteus TaxID=2268456 RepID=UPI000E670040
MAAQALGALILWLLIAAIVIVVAVYILRWLYRRSTKDTAFVRTGFGGEKVVVNGGAFVIPVLHETTPVNMNVMRIDVARRESRALITKNRMRVDVSAEFFVKVGSTKEAVAAAAQTLSRRTLDGAGMRDLLEGKFAGALRTMAAQMTLEDMHERRKDYAQLVKEMASEDLARNGLDLESVAIVDLDQTRLEFFDPSNAFDAEGLTQLTESIEGRRRMRNEIEQRTQVDIRTQNLDAQRKVLDIDRESEYARLAQEQEIEVRRAVQRTELAKERALRDQESEQAQLAAREEIEKFRLAQERSITEARIRNEEDTQRREIARRRGLEEVEMKTRELTEREQIALGLSLEVARIEREREEKELDVKRRRSLELAELERQIVLAAKAVEVTKAESEKKRAEIASAQELEASRIAQERIVDQARLERERALESLQIAKRQAFEEAEISAGEEVERARISTERGLSEARIVRDSELRQLTVEKDRLVETAELQKSIDLAKKSAERSLAIVNAETARAKAVQAEEQAFTAREREIAERRKLTEIINAQREAERDAVRLTVKADSEKKAATAFADARKISAQGEAESVRILAKSAAERFEVDAKGHRQMAEAENVLSEGARHSRYRSKLLDKVEGIVRESVRPLENIEGIKILHVDGMNGGAGGNRNVTDEVIDSALRYRVQAPMIDSLMKDIGIEGGSVGRMTEVLRDAKDIVTLTKEKGKGRPERGKSKAADTDDDRDR